MPADGQTGRRTDGQTVRGFLALLRRIAGMPDYAAYLEHSRRHHPESAPLSERDFFNQYLETRYRSGATRCC
jgi:uncharacterized short protein YbdD (DUF466 family)